MAARGTNHMPHTTYTHPPIPGKLPQFIMPKGYALVCEGGGTRGFYSAGVFEAFMDAGIMFPYIIGVSAGAANALTYIAGQKLRSRQIVEYYVGDHRYVSKRNLLFHRSMFNLDFIFHTVPQKHIFFDWEIFQNCNVQFLTGAFNCITGETVWFEKKDITPGLEANIASASVPILSPIVTYQGYQLLDGGIGAPIPIEKSIADGNTFHVIILTRNQGYIKPPFQYKRLLKLFYKNNPAIIDALLHRHETYNRQLALCERLEREGKAIIIRPQQPLKITNTTGNHVPALLELYDEGHAEGKELVRQLHRF